VAIVDVQLLIISEVIHWQRELIRLQKLRLIRFSSSISTNQLPVAADVLLCVHKFVAY